MKIRLLAFLFLWQTSLFAESSFGDLKQGAEKYFSEKSFSKAREIYQSALKQKLSPEEKRWAEFRLADCSWRAAAGSETADSTPFDQAFQALNVLVRDASRPEDKDLVWAEVQESLGDFYWTRRNQQQWYQAWPYYQNALDFWAGSQDLNLARERYLNIVWTVARPPWAEPYYYYGYYGNTLPADAMENVLKIAQTDEDKAHASYLLAMSLRYYGGDWHQQKRTTKAFEEAIHFGKKTEWYDDALYYYGENLMSYGEVRTLENGAVVSEPNYVKALEVFRKLLKEFGKGETSYYDQAKSQVESITAPNLLVSLGNVFLPDSEIQFYLSWRNLDRVDFTVYRVDLAKDVNFKNPDNGSANWIQEISLGGREKTKSWSKEVKNVGYIPGQETVRLEGKLSPGAYVLEAKGGGQSSRDLLLVTEGTLVVKNARKQTLVYFCNAQNGSPIPEASVKLWERYYDGNRYRWRSYEKNTDAQGLISFELKETPNNNREIFVGASAKEGASQAFVFGYGPYWYDTNNGLSWKIYAFTDRPAYRPKEEVQFKWVARVQDGKGYQTPARQTLEFEITDPQGAKVKEGKTTLSDFGSAWDSLKLTETMPLGEYRISFYDSGRNQTLGNAVLFRLEEYKLPEFQVKVSTPEENGRKKIFRVGETVEAEVQADYFFGGAVANANVEVLVTQNPYHHYWYPSHDYEWFYKDFYPQNPYYGGGQIVKRETLKTDANGKARVSFETPQNTGQDYSYTIEARVTDSSRREISGSAAIKVTRQSYNVHLYADHYLYRPQDKVTIHIKTMDANGAALPVEGRVKLSRDRWQELWTTPEGKEMKGPSQPGWTLKFQGYEHEELSTQSLKTNDQGEAEFTFTPERDGYYRVSWSSQDKDGAPISTETTVWTATNTTTDLGYRYGGVQILVDQDTFHAGRKVPVMLCAPSSDRYVLFSTETEDIHAYQLVHMTGSVKLLELDVTEEHVPNIFLSACLVQDLQLMLDNKQVIVPPEKNFLNVELASNQEAYLPREKGSFTLHVKDHEGRPVSAELSLGIVDESVYSIQEDYAGDLREFYFGTKRTQTVQTLSTFQCKSFLRWMQGKDGNLVDARNELKPQSVPMARECDSLQAATLSLCKEEGGARQKQSRDEEYRAVGAVGGEAKKAKMDRMDAPAAPAAEAAAPPPAGGKDGYLQAENSVQVRNDFRSTIFWQPDLKTDAEGKASATVPFADSLTTWKGTCRVTTAQNQFGIATLSVRTRQPLIVRLQAPRFFVVGDLTTVSAVVNNNTEEALSVLPTLHVEGLTVSGFLKDGKPVKGELAPISVPPQGEGRVDWVVSVQTPGEAKIKVIARSEKYSDAMEKSYPVHEHGIEQFLCKSGKTQKPETLISLSIPKERKKESTALSIQISPSLAVTMLDALPYLLDYPYGCTEQTLSRFLPATMVSKTLKDLGLNPEEVQAKMFGGIEKEFAEKTHPQGTKSFSLLPDIISKSLDRLYDFQHSDGGWGWWKEGDSDHYMSAYVLWGLSLAQKSDVDVRSGCLESAAKYLNEELVEQERSPDLQSWMLFALATHHALRHEAISKFQKKAFDNLWKQREKLNAYTRALLALSAWNFGFKKEAQTLIENLENGVQRDSAPDVSGIQKGDQVHLEEAEGTAHWGNDGVYWRWSEGGVEATAFGLQALLTVDPKNKLVGPVTNWLLKNRRGAQWSNTKDTAIVLLTMTDYLKTSGELNTNTEFEVQVNGKTVATQKITKEDILKAPSLFKVDPALIQDGENTIRLLKKGEGALYFSAQALFFNQQEPIPSAGHEIFARRQYYKIVGRPTLLKGVVYEKAPLRDGDSLKSGERVESVLTIESKNNYDYLLFEDLKPAGFEAVEIKSGESLYARQLKSGTLEAHLDLSKKSDEQDYTGKSRSVYQELRDRKAALFIDHLPQGLWEIRHELRAETPGTFHALPLLGHAMYVPEIRCNGEETRVTVQD